MDEITLLRSAREDVAPPTADAVDAGRDALIQHIGARPARRHRGLKRAGWATGGTLVAAGVATALVLGNRVGLAGWRGGADAAAAETLAQAAVAAIQTSDPVVGPGQYLEISAHEVDLIDGDGIYYFSPVSDQMYIPADLSADWFWNRPVPGRETALRPQDQAIVDGWRKLNLSDPNFRDEHLRAPGGYFYGSAPQVTAESLADLPSDPYRLLNYIYRVTLGHGQSPDSEAYVFIADQLRSGIVPAAQRATFYRALALIPGVSVSDPDTELDGRSGVAISRTEGSVRTDLIINPHDGLVIGERNVQVVASQNMPAGSVRYSRSLTTTVVDSVPRG